MSGCEHPRCDGEIHWTGGKEADTGADEEEGACPVGPQQHDAGDPACAEHVSGAIYTSILHICLTCRSHDGRLE